MAKTKILVYLAVFYLVAAAYCAVALLLAQITVFALSQYHINSGLRGPWLLILVAESVIAGGVSTGSRTAKKNL